jgi:hypothetical protein
MRFNMRGYNRIADLMQRRADQRNLALNGASSIRVCEAADARMRFPAYWIQFAASRLSF